ncbi:GNAT family N-acetyltransferase [Galbibacter sp. EGI 63066]|uniref:GNAT family N-acetyltransferase n=1 Tax=Galbibacter sp. EGI 63066 TaxID=2993559 RepID=UPI002248FC7F|nr:GNAT family N-acetyltransferase [Galbibacter sp. EGI 63066]MCX2679757.1 GNAT family N-acetyltransferase [Galbibacter sp. EGI 63066]
MIKAVEYDKEQVIEILTSSFDKNQSTNFVIKQDSKREERFRRLIEYSFFMGMEFGDVFMSENKKACAIILYHHKKKTSLKALLWDVKLVFGTIGLKKVFKIMKREALLKTKYPKEKFAHLWYIGVDPKVQSKGIGTELMNAVLQSVKLPVYLETSTERNLPFYRKFEFEVIDTVDELGYKLYLLKK